MAREVSVAAKTRRRRRRKRGRTVRFIGKWFFREQLGFVAAKCGTAKGSMELGVSVSDPSFSAEPLGIDEEGEIFGRKLMLGVNVNGSVNVGVLWIA